MLKAGEIGDALFVSVNTVKAHLRSIYRKLDVRNRREAVDRAKMLRLLDSPTSTAGEREKARD
jgi:LuxR family maltose regulon positive regulatory protein